MKHMLYLAALCMAATLVFASASLAQTTDLYDCPDFATQEEAQGQLLAGDPYGLDDDNDGQACDDLPSGGDTTGGGVAPIPGSAECPNIRITPDGRQCSDLPDVIPGDTQYAQPETLTQVDLDCADFASQAEAQAVLDAAPSDPNGLDADNDGIACEETFSAPPTQATQQYEQPVSQTPSATQTTTTALPATGGLPLAPLAGASLLVLGVAGLAMRRRVP